MPQLPPTSSIRGIPKMVFGTYVEFGTLFTRRKKAEFERKGPFKLDNRDKSTNKQPIGEKIISHNFNLCDKVMPQSF